MSDALTVANNMINAWLEGDWAAATELFEPQGRLVIVPTRTTYTGHAEIRGHLDEVAGPIENLFFNTRILTASGNIVTFERDDEFTYNGRDAKVPCVGIFEITGEYVTEWREYFDGLTMGRAVGAIKSTKG